MENKNNMDLSKNEITDILTEFYKRTRPVRPQTVYSHTSRLFTIFKLNLNIADVSATVQKMKDRYKAIPSQTSSINSLLIWLQATRPDDIETLTKYRSILFNKTLTIRKNLKTKLDTPADLKIDKN